MFFFTSESHCPFLRSKSESLDIKFLEIASWAIFIGQNDLVLVKK